MKDRISLAPKKRDISLVTENLAEVSEVLGSDAQLCLTH